MHTPSGPVPVDQLVPVALHRIGALLCIDRADYPGEIYFDGNCRDPFCAPNQHAHIKEIQGKTVIRMDRIGGIMLLSEHCPGSCREERVSILKEYRFAVTELRAHVGSVGVHGEQCVFCQVNRITVAQRIWLGIHGRNILKQVSMDTRDPWIPDGELGVFTTYHRRYMKHEVEHQKTRRLDHNHQVFTELPLSEVMRMNDHDVVQALKPELLELAV